MQLHAPITRRGPALVRSATSAERLSRRQLLWQRSKSMTTRRPSRDDDGTTAAEVCGGTTAGCAAVCCCFPYGVVNLIVLAVYKVPAKLCRKALRHRKRRRLMSRGMSLHVNGNGGHRCRYGEIERSEEDWLVLKMLSKEEEETAADEAVAKLEKEMWNRFYETGFWRSPSQCETTSSVSSSQLV